MPCLVFPCPPAEQHACRACCWLAAGWLQFLNLEDDAVPPPHAVRCSSTVEPAHAQSDLTRVTAAGSAHGHGQACQQSGFHPVLLIGPAASGSRTRAAAVCSPPIPATGAWCADTRQAVGPEQSCSNGCTARCLCVRAGAQLATQTSTTFNSSGRVPCTALQEARVEGVVGWKGCWEALSPATNGYLATHQP